LDRQRFENEIKIYATLKTSHSNVSQFYGISFDEEHMIIVGEFLEGGTLPDWFKQKHPKSSESEGFWTLFCSVIQMIAQGLAFLHDHYVIWNNVHTHQCLVSKEGVVKICHFHSSIILQQDDPLSELAFRNEIVQLGLAALNLGLGRFTNAITIRAAAHGSSNVADQIHAAASIPANWPDFVRDLITSMLRTDLEPRLNAEEVSDRIKRILDV
jgi:serine/threonine protein kinase